MRLHGYLDEADRRHVRGWAVDLDAPDTPASLVVTANGELVGRVLANAFRGDLQATPFGPRHGFSLDFASPLSPLAPHTIEVRGELTGEHLVNSPWRIDAATAFDGEAQAAVAALLAGFESEAELEERLAFLAQQTDMLLHLHSRRHDGLAEQEARRKLRWRKAETDAPARTASKPRALVIDDHAPVATRDAGSVAILSHLRSLQRIGYDVTFVPADQGLDRGSLDAAGITCLTRPWYGSVEEVLARHAGAFETVYIHRLSNASAYLTLARRHNPGATLLFGVADLVSLRTARQAACEDRPELEGASRTYTALEIDACRRADAVLTHSSFESALLKARLGDGKVHTVPFSVTRRAVDRPFTERHGVAFIGNYGHAPNVDAARWLVDAVMPLVAAARPGLECLLVGAAMPDHLRRLETATVRPLGAVADLDEVFRRVRLTVAPLAYGAGVKGKVLESLAAGVPCACTPSAVEGLELPPLLDAVVGHTPEELATVMLRLHEDADFNERCAQAGLQYIAAHASDRAVDNRLRAALRTGRRTS